MCYEINSYLWSRLDLDNNNLTGTIPDTLGGLTTLQYAPRCLLHVMFRNNAHVNYPECWILIRMVAYPGLFQPA